MSSSNVTRIPKPKILKGIKEVSDTVKLTIGPHGRNIIMDQFGHVITNDGVSIAKEVRCEDKVEQLGVEFIQDVAKTANNIAGDGTSTTIVLTSALAELAFDALNGSERVSVTQLRSELKSACNSALEYLFGANKGITDDSLLKIARLSAESDELGKLIADAVLEVGEHGTVLYESDAGKEVTCEMKQGYTLETGYKNPHLMNTQDSVTYDDVPALIWNKNFTSLEELAPLMEQLLAKQVNKLVLFCAGIEDSVTALCIQNHVKEVFHLVPVPIYGYLGDIMDDIAHFTGAKYIHQMATPTLDDLGKIDKFTQTDAETIFSSSFDVTERINEINVLKSGKERKDLEKRISKLSGKLAIIKVGAESNQEKEYLLRKVEDAVNASLGAKNGYLPGGGCAYVHAAKSLKKKDKGTQILKKALYEPLKNILRNADIDETVIKRIEKGKTFNALTGKLDSNVIDSYLTVTTALKKSVSAVSTLLTIEGAITRVEKKTPTSK